MKFSMSVDLRGIKSLQKKLQALSQTEVEVGFFPESKYGEDNNNLHVAAVALMQERGAADYPSRPFFSNTVEDKMVHFHLARALSNVVKSAFKDGRSVRAKIIAAGEVLKDELMTAIEDYPGSNSPSWAAIKGKNDPLSYTDKMLNSVKVKIKK